MKITNNVKAMKAGHRKATLGLNLQTRTAPKDKRKDAHAQRRAWKNKKESI